MAGDAACRISWLWIVAGSALQVLVLRTVRSVDNAVCVSVCGRQRASARENSSVL